MGALYGAAKIRRIPQASQMFLCWLEEAIVRRVVTYLQKRASVFRKPVVPGGTAMDRLRSYGHRWSERSSGSGDLIEAGLSTYEKECAKRGDDYRKFLPSRSVKRWSVVQPVLTTRLGGSGI